MITQRKNAALAAMGTTFALLAVGCANTAENCELIGFCGGKDVPSAGGTGGMGGTGGTGGSAGAGEMGGSGGAGGMAPVCSESWLSHVASDMQSAENMHIAPNGSLVVTGNFAGKLVLSPTTTLDSAGLEPEFFLARYNTDLTLINAFPVHAFLLDSAIDTKGNLLVIGTHTGAVALPTGCEALPATSGLFAFKLDAADKCVWAKSYALGAGTQIAARVAMSSTGDVAIAGAFSGSIEGLSPTSTLTSVGTKDIFVAKLDVTGSSSWGARYGQTGQTQEARAVIVDAAGEVLIAGDYEGTLNFNDAKLGIMTSTNHTGFVAKFASNGMSLAWQKAFVLDSGVQHVTAMVLNGSNEVVVAGDINGTSSADELDATQRLFLAKLGRADGKFTLVKGVAGSGAPVIHDIAVAANDRMVMTGHFDDKLDFGSGELGTGTPGERFFFAVFDKDGVNPYAITNGTMDDLNGEKRGLGVAVNGPHAFVAGHFEGTMSLAGQSRTSGGDKDIFAAELCLP